MSVPPKPRTPPTVTMGWKMFSGEEMAEERWGAAIPRMERKMMMEIGRREIE